jgi:alpha-1,2-mannosyltransferase
MAVKAKNNGEYFGIICSIFLAANLCMIMINHIDDTDETYGYYEPLHYLIYGIGMQTWEYAPQYAIRTYTFISPFWAIGFVLKSLNFSKLNIFYGIRIFLGLFTAISETFFVSTIHEKYGEMISEFTFIFLLFSSGVLYCSTGKVLSMSQLNSLCK